MYTVIWTTKAEDIITFYSDKTQLTNSLYVWFVQLHLNVTNRTSVTTYRTDVNQEDRNILTLYQYHQGSNDVEYEDGHLNVYYQGRNVVVRLMSMNEVRRTVDSYFTI